MRHPHHRAIAVVFAVHGAVAGSMATRMPWLQQHLGLDPALLGVALLCPALGALVAMPTAGRLAHRYGGRAATRTLIALWCAALAVPALMPGLPWLCAAMVLYGAAAGAADVVMNAQGVLVERGLGRPLMSGLHGMWSVGNFTAAGVGAVAAQAAVDARLHLALMAAVLLTAVIPLTRGLPGARPQQGDSRHGEPEPPRFALPSRGVLAIGLVGLCATVTELSGMQWAAVYTIEVTGASQGTGAVAYAVFAGVMVVARLAGDAVVGRLGPVTAVRAGAVLATAGAAVVALGRVPAVTVTGFALLGIGVAVIVPLVFAAAGNAGPSAGEGVAGVATITYLSGLAAPAVTGWVAQATSFPAAFGLIACLTAAMGGFAHVLRPRDRAHPAAAGRA